MKKMFHVRKVSQILVGNTRTVFNIKTFAVTTQNMNRSREVTTIEGFQGNEKNISLHDARVALEEAIEYSIHGPSVQGIQGGHDEYAGLSDNSNSNMETNGLDAPENITAYHCEGNINLHGCMQSNVPNPYSTMSSQNSFSSTNLEHDNPQNMPGNGRKLLQKYISAGQNDVRTFHTSAISSVQAAHVYENDDYSTNDSSFPQGIQGDECVQYRLWLENCQRYGLPNCDEQLQSLQSGRKTLAQIFAEQEELIKAVAFNYRKNSSLSRMDDLNADVQGIQMAEYTNIPDLVTPCPQGIQGDDCVSFKLWLENCHRFGIQDCQEHLQGIQSGRKTLAEVFEEQDKIIYAAVQQYKTSKRGYSTSSSGKNSSENEVGKAPSDSENISSNTDDHPSNLSKNPDPNLTARQRLKKAVAEYGSTVIVFHVGISLMSLGGFYVLVSSGVDVIGLLVKAGIGEEFFKSKLAAGASTFVVAYAVHKVFAPVRIGITLTATPLIVRYLRQKGFLKPVKKKE